MDEPDFEADMAAIFEAFLRELANPRMHCVFYDESQRQIILLALFKLKQERPGWADAIERIEAPLGGQLDWPEDAR